MTQDSLPSRQFLRLNRLSRIYVLSTLIDEGPRSISHASDVAAAWWLVSQGLVTHRDGIFVYVGPVKAEAVAS